jgi:hypothetical protein
MADWLDEVEDGVADHEEAALEADVVPELAVDVEELVVVVSVAGTVAVAAARAAIFAPRPTKAETLRAAATIRERAAACRRFVGVRGPVRVGRCAGPGPRAGSVGCCIGGLLFDR